MVTLRVMTSARKLVKKTLKTAHRAIRRYKPNKTNTLDRLHKLEKQAQDAGHRLSHDMKRVAHNAGIATRAAANAAVHGKDAVKRAGGKLIDTEESAMGTLERVSRRAEQAAAGVVRKGEREISSGVTAAKQVGSAVGRQVGQAATEIGQGAQKAATMAAGAAGATARAIRAEAQAVRERKDNANDDKPDVDGDNTKKADNANDDKPDVDGDNTKKADSDGNDEDATSADKSDNEASDTDESHAGSNDEAQDISNSSKPAVPLVPLLYVPQFEPLILRI